MSLNSIISGLIGTAIFYFLLPFFKKFGNWLITFLSKISKSFSNYLYKSLSIGSSIEPLLSLLIIVPILLIVNILIYQQTVNNSKLLAGNQHLNWIRYLNNEIVNINETLNLLDSKRIIKNDSSIKIQKIALNKQKEILLNADKKRQRISKKIENNNRKSENLFFASNIVSFFILIFFYFKYLIYGYILSKNRDFKNKLIVLKPYITEKEYNELRKDWILITNEEDFKKINNTINEYFSKYDSK